MKIALIGHGVMGQLVVAEATAAGDDVALIVTSKDRDLKADVLADKLRGQDVAIDFSVGEAVLRNIEACARAGVPLVEGTTGWKAHEATAKEIVDEHGAGLVYGPNFSVGVNLFYRIVERAAELFKAVDGYAPFIEEAHHMRKRDAPSGTARAGFDSEGDQIMLVHEARSRRAFASGALVAAHWIVGRTGVFQFSEVIDELVGL